MSLVEYPRPLSIWEIAHRAEGQDPNHNNQPPLEVQDLLRNLTYAATFQMLRLVWGQNGSSIKYPDEFIEWDPWLEQLNEKPQGRGELKGLTEDELYQHWWQLREDFSSRFYAATKSLERCFEKRIFDKEKLDSIYTERHFFGAYCLESGMKLPEFWFDEAAERVARENAKWILHEGSNNEQQVEQSLDHNFVTTTPRLRRFNEIAIQAWTRFWKNIDPLQKDTIPLKEDIENWLLKEFAGEIGKQDAKLLQRLIRHPSFTQGGRRPTS